MHMDNSLEKIEVLISFLRQKQLFSEDQLQELQQQFQDASDFFLPDKITAFKEAYKVNDIRRCAFLLSRIVIEDNISDKRGIRKLLYRENPILPNPLNYSVSDDEIKKVERILLATVDYFDRKEKPRDDSSKGIYSSIIDQLIQIVLFYNVEYYNHKKNEEQLAGQTYLKCSLPEIFQSMLVFYQDQLRLARRTLEPKWKNQQFITGMEGRVADRNSDMYPTIKVSLDDNFELLIEQMDALFRYIYYLKPDDFENLNCWNGAYLSPYESIDFEKLFLLCMGDVLYTKLESRFRYTESEITLTRDPNNVPVVVFGIGDADAQKVHIAAGLRREHNQIDAIKIAKEIIERSNDSINVTSMQDVEDSIGDDAFSAADTCFFQEYIPASLKMDVSDIESFQFDKMEYAQLKKLLEPNLLALRISSKDYYFECKFSNLKIEDYLDAYIYLYTLSKVYYVAALRQMNDDDPATYSVLIPFVNVNYLYQEFSNLHPKLSFKKAKKLINCFVFDNQISKDKSKGDLFTRPLVKVNQERVLLSEALIHQINLHRNIEVILESHGVDVAPMGKAMEKRVVRALSAVNTISVNTAPVDFAAYDGRNVEFDCIATFDDYLVLIEMKSLFVPYSDFDLFKRKKRIKDGVEQVNRRMKVVEYDWDKIRKSVNIKLPEKPYPKEKIIKLVCADIGDFTSLEIDGVTIIDEATLLKYFKNPYIEGAISEAGKLRCFKKQVLWMKYGRPTVEEFIEYIHNPDTVKFILETMGITTKPIYLHDGCKGIAFEDITIDKDPWAELAKKYCIK